MRVLKVNNGIFLNISFYLHFFKVIKGLNPEHILLKLKPHSVLHYAAQIM